MVVRANKIGLTHGRIAQIVRKFKTEEINEIKPHGHKKEGIG